MNKLVSIITPCYNSSDYILETIQSVQNQSYTNWEMLITDDGSIDNSTDLIKSIIEYDPRVKLFIRENEGPAKARNNSIKKAKGKYLAFLDSDDLWNKDFLEKSIIHCDKSDGFICSSYNLLDNDKHTIYRNFIVPDRANYNDILKQNSISCLTAFIDIERLGKEYMPEVQYRQDMGLWLKYLKKIPYVLGIKEPLATYRIRQGSHSRNKIKLLKHQWHFYRKVTKLSFLKSIYYIFIWGYKGFLKYR